MVSKEQFLEAVRAINELDELVRKQKKPHEDLILEYYAEQDQIRQEYIRLRQEERNRQTTWCFDNTKLNLN